MSWREKAQEIAAKVKKYQDDADGWKPAKQSKDVTVVWKPSPDWNGALYKAEAIVNSDPQTVFSYIEPSPNSPRSKWDKAVKQMEVVEKLDDDLSVVRCVTHSAFGGLISSRDFIDLVLTIKNDGVISTNSQGVEHDKSPPNSDQVRGVNHPCSIACHSVPGEPNKTKVISYIQTDLGGMLPKSLVENALPSNQVDFFTALKNALKDDGKLKSGMENGDS